VDQPRGRITTPGITAAACIPPFAAGPIKKMIEAEAASEITDHDIRVDLAEPVQEIKQPDQSHADLDGAVRHQQEQATDQRNPIMARWCQRHPGWLCRTPRAKYAVPLTGFNKLFLVCFRLKS